MKVEENLNEDQGFEEIPPSQNAQKQNQSQQAQGQTQRAKRGETDRI